MQLTTISDRDLLSQTKTLATKERELLTQVLQHLKEINNRKLFCDLGYQSLFEYCVKELKYSEGQAGRRIQAMRIIKEIPEIEQKVASGDLSLSNISQAQSYFRESKKNNKVVSTSKKKEILGQLEKKSYREAKALIFELNPNNHLPNEKQIPITETHTEVHLIMDDNLKHKLESAQSLLGVKSMDLDIASLIERLADEAIVRLKEKKFGKTRIRSD